MHFLSETQGVKRNWNSTKKASANIFEAKQQVQRNAVSFINNMMMIIRWWTYLAVSWLVFYWSNLQMGEKNTPWNYLQKMLV